MIDAVLPCVDGGREYFGDGDECHKAYHFPLMPRMYMAIAQEDRHPVTAIAQQTPEIPDSYQWGIFLRNHDELTLEMVTSKERDYLNRMYAADSRAKINLGIGGAGTCLMPLTDEGSKPAVPFGGRYRIAYFVLSNLVNSDIDAIYVLVQYKSQPLIDHLTHQ